MNIAVLLTCHNRKNKTLECLANLYKQNKVNNFSFDIYLVDDGSTDGTGEAVLDQFPEVNVIQGNGELFWNRGMCLAWETARENGNYDGVIWLNDDTLLYSNALEVLNNNITEHPNSIIVGTIESSQTPGHLTYGGRWKGNVVNPNNEVYECDKINGNFVLVPKTVSDRIGYLDPYYRHSIGDSDYGLRAKRNGVKVIVTPIVGSCDRNPTEPNWNKGTLIERFKKLYSPLGNNPFETFHYHKQFSYVKALAYFVYIHLRVLLSLVFPKK